MHTLVERCDGYSEEKSGKKGTVQNLEASSYKTAKTRVLHKIQGVSNNVPCFKS